MASSNTAAPMTPEEKEEALTLFEELLRYPTISFAGPTNGSYRACAQWLVKTLSDLGLETKILELVPNKPVVLASWIGTEPELPSLLLNSHYDVVPAVLDHWYTDPFTPVRKDGKIYARGTQDMKCVCAQYILAIKRLKHQHPSPPPFLPRRSIHLSFVPDEEIGGEDGMAPFLLTSQFKNLNVGLALDEGIANPLDEYTFFYGERMPLWIRVKAQGNTGHGSRFIPGTAVGKIIEVANKGLAFRAVQEKTLGYFNAHSHEGEGEGGREGGNGGGGCKHAQAKKLGDVTSLNLTMLKAGVSMDGGETFAFNVIPHEAEAGFDMRVPPSVSFEEVRKLLDEWTNEEGVSWEFAQEGGGNPLLDHHITSIDRAKNPWFSVFYDALASRGVKLTPEVFPASTDARFVRAVGVAAFGFSPMRKTEILLHEHNEWVGEEGFVEGVQVYETLIRALSGAGRFEGEGEGEGKK